MRLSILDIKISSVLFVSIMILLLCCNSNKKSLNIAPKAEAYLIEVMSLLREKSVNRNKIDWDKFNAEVHRLASHSQTIENTYPAVRFAVKELKDNHSYFVAVNEGTTSDRDKLLPILKDEITPPDIAYIRLPFCIGNNEQTDEYILTIIDRISLQNNNTIKGWIIDLRDNFGGNMWPMMVAIGCFLDHGIQGYFVGADNKAFEWRYEQGKAYLDTIILAETKQLISLCRKTKVAVLINNQTASSGEAMAVLFKGYTDAKIFGVPTFGVSTGCESYTLSDGSRINLATSVFADRNKRKYGGAVYPDITCSENETLANAIVWIYK
ncbi:MAG: S41 family peptidase [Saprospiraceae bacterium]